MACELEFHLENPPVVELVAGVQFDPVAALNVARLGFFWRELGSEWADADVQASPAIPPQFEHFGEESALPYFPALRVQMMPEMRLRILRSTKDRMVQVQNGSLYYNWLRQEGATYPSYGGVKQEFGGVVSRFCEFLERERLGKFTPNQWELTYIDHIPRGTLWNSPEEWPRIFRKWSAVPTEHPDLQMESLAAEWHYEIKPRAGRLHLKLATGRIAQPAGNIEVLIVNTTARGPVKPAETDALYEGLDRGHRELVAVFKTLTSDFAQNSWGPNNA
jgi:uncharacterized protein (TIGR04255 family)